MDIIVQTNAKNPSMAFREWERFTDGSGYCAELAVRSGWISVDYHFVFETSCLEAFLTQLDEMDRRLTGTARLKPLFEDQFIEFICDRGGHVWIRGDLVEYSGLSQRVQFEFRTDQTCLRPLIDSLRQAAG